MHIWIVSEKHRACLHLKLSFHVCGTDYFCYSCAMGWDPNGSRKGQSLSLEVLLAFYYKRLPSVHSFLVPSLVQLMEIAFGMVKSLPSIIGLFCLVQNMNV